MITDFDLFDVANGAPQYRDTQPQILRDIARHLFVKHYLYCFAKQVTTIRYVNRERAAAKDRVLIALIRDRFDKLFFGCAWLVSAAFDYSATRRLVVTVQMRDTPTEAAKIADCVVGALCAHLLARNHPVGRGLSQFVDMSKFSGDTLAGATKLAAYGLTLIDCIFGKIGSYEDFNAKHERALLKLVNINEVGDVRTFAPVGIIDKIFIALNTLYTDTDRTPTDGSDDTDHTDHTDGSAPASSGGGWGNLGDFTRPAAEPAPELASGGGWGNLGDFGSDEATKDTPNGAKIDDAQTAEKTAENDENGGDYAEIVPAVAAALDAPQIVAALSKHEFSKAAQGLAQYILCVAAPDCINKMKKGIIATASDYYVELKPRDILRMLGETPTTERARSIEAAAIELHHRPLKYTRFVKERGKLVKKEDSFQLIVHIQSKDDKIKYIQFAPSIVTDGHIVNTALRQFLPVSAAFAGGRYVLGADCTDVDTVVNSIIKHVGAGNTVFWSRVFDDFTFADTNQRRTKTKILQSFDRRGFDVEKVGKLGFIFRASTVAAAVEPAPELATAPTSKKTSSASKKAPKKDQKPRR